MSCPKLKLICFSPTRTTRKVLGAIAEGVKADSVEIIDVSRIDRVPASYGCNDDDLVIIGVPVYSGRVPVVALERFSALKASGTPVVPVVVYGNREYDDALLELVDMTIEAGFKPVAAAAFIGEHSFSTDKYPIAVNRPDSVDLNKAREFGECLRDKFAMGEFSKPRTISVPGNANYKERQPKMSAAPVSSDSCLLCGSCERICPSGAITVSAQVETDPEKCIFCCACVKVCASGARILQVPRMIEISKWLADNCKERKVPEIFI
ncbi:4Fe-4S binding protein [Maridesulfovibrio zosterae]|uniref:4Fe-4S binding protein n=1 Tax=Maridesulfovibrio zosterae TaxID=82171 RepID=UPI00041CF22E|nr:4Fe-4S binding protein [Maridesulfovibrio zosterae]